MIPDVGEDDTDTKKYKMLSRTRMLMNEPALEAPCPFFLFLIFPKEILIARMNSKASKQRTGMNR